MISSRADGRGHWPKGKKQSPQTCEKKRVAHLGKRLPEKVKAKISAAHLRRRYFGAQQ